MKKFIFLFLGMLIFGFSTLMGQLNHEGALKERMLIGRHVWSNEAGQIRAEVIYDENGVVVSFRTWDEKGLLIDEEKLNPKRERKEFPKLDLVYEEDGYGFLLMHGMAATDAPSPRAGEKVSVYYEGYLQDGTIFDSNYGSKKPFRFKYDMGEVVPGFDRAISMLKVGEEGYFWMPSELAYGDVVAGTIPPFSNLLFRIKLVDLN